MTPARPSVNRLSNLTRYRRPILTRPAEQAAASAPLQRRSERAACGRHAPGFWASRRRNEPVGWPLVRFLRGAATLVTPLYGRSGSVFESPAFVAGLDDIAVVSEAVEQCRGHFGVAKYIRPFAEG